MSLKSKQPAKVGISGNSLVQLAESERRNFEALRDLDPASVDRVALAEFAITRGRALHRYVVMDATAAMPDLSFSDPAVTSLLDTANNYVRLGTHLKAESKEPKRHG